MGIFSNPVFYLKHNVTETGICFRLQVEPTQLDPTERASLCLRTGAAQTGGSLCIRTGGRV
jgi:hypothetical protein